MIRTMVLFAINVTLALVMAASVMPMAIVVAPIVRETPAAGYAIVGVAIVLFAGMNIMFWRWWKR